MDKKAYPQGTEEPKVYPLMGDPNLRSKDKHMDGAELNTSVDNPDQKMKEMLKRAHVSVKMKKSASPGNDRWTVFANDEAVLSYTAEQAFGDALDEVSEDFPGKTNAEVFASKEYAKELIRAAKSGALVAQAAEMGLLPEEEMIEEADKAAPAEMDLEPVADEVMVEADKAEMMPMDDAPMAPEAALKDSVVAALERLEECMAELRNAVLGGDEGVDNVDIDLAPAVASLNSKMLKGYAVIDSLASELRNAKTANLSNPAIRLNVRAALRDAQAAELETIEVLAELEAAKEADCNDSMMLDDQDLHEVREEISGALEDHEEVDHVALLEDIETLQEEIKDLSDGEKADLDEAAEAFKGALSAHDGATETAEKRAAYRASLVARAAAVESSSMLENAHKGDTKKMLDTPVMTSSEKQKAALDVVSREPKSGVKKAAAGLDQAIKSGKIAVAQLDYLVSVAAVDAEAAKYWREFYGEVDKEFASELTKDFKKATASTEDLGIKYKRAFDVASEAQAKGLIESGRASLESCVDSLVSGTDANFVAFKSLASKIKAPSKQAGFIPQMGVDTVVKTASAQVNVTDARALSKALWDID